MTNRTQIETCGDAWGHAPAFWGVAPATRRGAFSLIELLIVLVIISVVAASLVTNANTQVTEQLEAAARILAADLDYARDLALSYHGQYRLTFNTTTNSWTLTYTGTDSTLTTLPRSPLHSPTDSATQQSTVLSGLPGISLPITIYSIYTQQSPLKAVTNVEFGPLGSTTESANSVIWLAAGNGKATCYVDVDINAVTGLATIGKFQSTLPPKATSAGTSGTGG